MSQTSTTSDPAGTQIADADTGRLSLPELNLRLHTAGMTDVGRVREHNEDQFLIAELTKALRVLETSLRQPAVHFSEEQGYLFLVADGMGGHAGGEQASALAVNTIEDFMLNTLGWFFHLKGRENDEALREFQQALARADDRVFQEAARNPALHGMGTTLTMAYSVESDLFVVHVGDSRCYLFRDRTLYKVTRDHTVVDEMLRLGYIDEKQAAHHRLRHVITNVIGGTRPGVAVEVHKVKLEAGDVLLLCSDGLTEMVRDQQIADLLHAEHDPRRVCERLIDEANAAGGRDNITVVVGRYEADG
jgi:protein phosphatase